MAKSAIGTPNASKSPVLQPGFRLVKAALRHAGAETAVYVPCAEWCVEDHVEEFQHFAEDIDHWGQPVPSWDTDSIERPGERILSLDARLHLDPQAADPRLSAAHVLLDDESVQAYLTPEAAEQTADELIALAANIRRLAREAREFNAHVEGGAV